MLYPIKAFSSCVTNLEASILQIPRVRYEDLFATILAWISSRRFVTAHLFRVYSIHCVEESLQWLLEFIASVCDSIFFVYTYMC